MLLHRQTINQEQMMHIHWKWYKHHTILTRILQHLTIFLLSLKSEYVLCMHIEFEHFSIKCKQWFKYTNPLSTKMRKTISDMLHNNNIQQNKLYFMYSTHTMRINTKCNFTVVCSLVVSCWLMRLLNKSVIKRNPTAEEERRRRDEKRMRGCWKKMKQSQNNNIRKRMDGMKRTRTLEICWVPCSKHFSYSVCWFSYRLFVSFCFLKIHT